MIAFYNILLLFVLWSYFQIIFTKIATVPPSFKIPQDRMNQWISLTDRDEKEELLKNFSNDLPIFCCEEYEGKKWTRFCKKCQVNYIQLL